MVEAIIRKAEQGNVRAFESIANRVGSRPVQVSKLEHSGVLQIGYVNDWRSRSGD